MNKRNSSQPRVLVTGDNRGRWSAFDREHLRHLDNGIEAWVYAFDGDYIYAGDLGKKEVAEYDIIIANGNWNWLEKYSELAPERRSGAKWVYLMESSATDHLVPVPFISEAMDASDLVNSINIHSTDFFQLMTKTKVEYIGIPHPTEGIAKKIIPYDKREKKIFLCPMLLKRWNDYFAAKEIGIEYYGYEQYITRKPKEIFRILLKHRSLNNKKYFRLVENLYKDRRLELRKTVRIENSFSANANAFLWMNLDDRYTWGRYVLDAAALQIPIITTKSTGHGEKLFPLTTVENEFCVREAIEIGKRLVSDHDFYEEVAKFPQDKMEEYSHNSMRKKLLSALNI